MTGEATSARSGLVVRFQDWAEELIYKLNEREHWLFRVYDWSNEVFAGLRFRGLRRRASTLDRRFETRAEVAAQIRFLQPEDEEIFAELLAGMDSRYLPPHGLDRGAAVRALRRLSYLSFGIFIEAPYRIYS